MENIVLYSHELNFDRVVDILETFMPDAKVEVTDNGKQKSLTATLKTGFFIRSKVLRINYRERTTPGYTLDRVNCPLSQNLAGMVNYVQSIPSKKPEITQKLVYAISAANCEMPFIGDPDIGEDFVVVLKKIVSELNCFIFSEPNKLFNFSHGRQFIDKNLNLILDEDGCSEVTDLEVSVNAQYADPPVESVNDEQWERKSKSDEFLRTMGVKVNGNLPVIPAVADTQLRSIEEVIDRIYALLVVAVRGEGLEIDQINRVIEDKRINSFSERELWVLNQGELQDGDRSYAAWRYESLTALMWAANLIDELPYPDQICNVQHVVGTIFRPSRDQIEQSAQLRSTEEIVDELDKTYRLHWATVDARVKGEEVGGSLEPGVVYERHYALNWLTNFMGQEWDDVQTPT